MIEIINSELELTVNENVGASDEFILNCTPLFNQSDCNIAYQEIPESLDENGILHISLEELEDNTTLAGAVPTLNLGTLNFGTEDFPIEVTLYNQKKKPKAKGHTRKTSAKGVGKPL